jgi:stage V sporulation protein G
MKNSITNIYVTPLEEGSALALASANINGVVIRGLRLMQSKKNGELWVGFPSRKRGEKWEDVCFVPDKELKQELDEAIIGAYNDKMDEQRGIAPDEEIP